MAAGQTLINKRRKLAELFKVGIEVRFGGRYGQKGALPPVRNGKQLTEFQTEDGSPDPARDDEIALWVQPPSPVQRDMALRDANAARARHMLTAKKDQDSEEYLTAMEFIDDMGDETLFDYVILGGIDERRQDALREVLAEDEWKDITELQDSLRVFEEEGRADDDPEVMAVAERETQLQEQVNKRELELREAELEVLRLQGVEKAREKAIERRAGLQASRTFMQEYERQMTFYSVRDIEYTATIFFESVLDMTSQPDELLELIQRAKETFIQDGTEAKNWQGAASGSTSSEPPSKQETSELFTPEG